MRLQLTADVEGSLFSQTPFIFQSGTVIYTFIFSNLGKIEKISISDIVPENIVTKFQSTIKYEGKGDIPRISIGGDLGTQKKLEEQLQLLESTLSFFTYFSLRKINWATPTIDFIPESEDEQELLPFQSISYGRSQPELRVNAEHKIFEFIVSNSNHDNKMVIDMAFWREGKYFQHNYQYIQAFYNFYFIIENLIGDGKYSKNDIRSRFLKSEPCKRLVLDAFYRIITKKRWITPLSKMCNFDINKPVIEDIVDLIITTRGALHHYSSKRKTIKPYPFIEEDYECVSVLLEFFTQSLILEHFGKVPIAYQMSKV